ncbi:MAG TPA: ribonuclease H-like domain-containing protein [Bacteroidota bacterium]|nr:ribonuclease H-like domain-containing protein [Bacteroidota bacterium]
MSSVIFDIETLAFELSSFDEIQQTYLLKFADTEDKREQEIQKLSLYPLTARIIAVAMLNPDTMAGKVFFQSDGKERFTSEDGKIEFRSGDEREILQGFWDTVSHYDQFVTFNGRSFDCPFIQIRSALLQVHPTRNLLPYRYAPKEHCDLLDQLTFYGAMRKFNLDFYCKAFGIRSPKGSGITGLDLGNVFREKRYREIAEYCLGDVVATAELYRRWNEFLHFEDRP